MPKITVISRNGSARDVEAENGLSLMEVIRDNGFDDVAAELDAAIGDDGDAMLLRGA